MKKRVFFIVAIVSSLFCTSCKEKCREGDEDVFGYLPRMESYFGMYKPGNFWIYKNQDSTKTDSIYISDFVELLARDKTECILFRKRTFKFHSKFIFSGDTIFNGSYANNSNCCDNHYYCIIGARMNSNINTHPVSASSIPETIYSSFNINNTNYSNVLHLEGESSYVKTDFAPQVGILKFINQTDTFLLKAYHIQ